jgi:3-phenylpropionate/cinnamic acid dioxygenase small subunit
MKARASRRANLNARYADAIDTDRLEAWPDFFLDDGRSRTTSAENIAQNGPLSLMYAAAQAMLRDRVSALRQDQCVRKPVLSPHAPARR